MLKFRSLNANEVYVRAQSVKANGCILLLYKDSRCDMNILDETVDPMGWQRSHSRDNANCIISIWDEKKSQWISKEDTGVESYTEKEKGLAADSFKRACFNWGIGRELYSAPFIWVNLRAEEILTRQTNGKTVLSLSYKTKFSVSQMTVEEGVIVNLEIVDGTGAVRYSLSGKAVSTKVEVKTVTKAQVTTLRAEMKKANIDDDGFYRSCKCLVSELPSSKYAEVIKRIKDKVKEND